jgi:hypothetical protein
VSKSLTKNLIVTILCISLILLQIFFPYFYYSSSGRNQNSTFNVGITYVYEEDNVSQIYGEVSQIHDLGFQTIRVDLVCDPSNTEDVSNDQTNAFFSAAQYFNISVAVIINNQAEANTIQYYLAHWGKYLSYIQILNEPELSSSWAPGAFFPDDEIINSFQQDYAIIQSYHLPAQLYTNFEVGMLLRPNIPIQLSKNLNFVGLDVYMQSFVVLSPDLVQFLHQITNKQVVITEFGMDTANDVAQANFLIQGLNLFKSMGLKGCWIAYWNDDEGNYGIRGRLAEQMVGEWIAENAKSN